MVRRNSSTCNGGQNGCGSSSCLQPGLQPFHTFIENSYLNLSLLSFPFLALLILLHTTFHIHCPGLIAAYHQPQGAIGIVLHGSTLLTNARLQGKLLLLLLHRFLTTATNNNTTNTNSSAWLFSVLPLPLIPHHDRDYYYFYRILVESA